ncbi:MAG: GNAT family protein [Hyphomicrobiaceae bacterium]|nr:GNAT family protein [Hyphomicrobiaceae bacterium]
MPGDITRYPAELIDVIHLERDGGPARVVVRPLLPQDRDLTGAFFAALSHQARRDRFMSPMREVTARLLERLSDVDHEAHVALVAEVFEDTGETLVGEARYVRSADGTSAEFAVTVAEGWRGLGLARLMLAKLACHAARAGIAVLRGETLASNAAMLHIARRSGFHLRADPEVRGVVQLEKALAPAAQGGTAPCGAAA